MQECRTSGASGRCPGMGIPTSLGSRLPEVSHQCRTMLGGGRGSSRRRRRITQLASNGTPRLSLPTGEVDAFVSVERAAAFRRNLSVAVRANEDQQSTRRARLFALPRRSARGHEDQFPTPRLSTRFSIAANVKPRPINSYRPPPCASAHLSHGALASLRGRRQATS